MPPPSTWGPATYLAVTSGAVTAALGLNVFLNPHHHTALLGRPLTASDRPLLGLYCARNLYIGASLIAVAVWGSKRALGALMAAQAVVALVDGLVVRLTAGTGAEWKHWPAVPLLGWIAGALLWP
ncbi:hypothetical protein JCM8097_002315 [Rhodosporidiobolus ruineniae]